ncbi:hypothetical protein GWK74_02830 [Candidatus Saccharibacteria bacterium oral taxon 488]|nr:hypothetical protein GWK74_02675 [Candidatus Saccharibacteria bacterium oral taxon 488]QHU90441.1 hypothetical protein GWK74_02830 [Candidatus Saccharibacteria bacterium oral taxon 488]
MASVSDKITKTMQGSNPNVARVVSPRAAGSDTLQVDSLSGWNEDTATHFMSYRVDSAGKVVAGSQRDWKGIANKATGQIISLSLQAGAVDDGNLVGDIIQAGPTASWSNDLASALLETHNTDGTLKDHIIEDKNIAKKSITAESIKDGGITADKINLATAQSLGYSIAAANLDSTNYYNAGSNRSRLKKQIIQRGNITIDGERNEFVIGENVKTVEITGTVMAEELRTYLYLIVQHKKKDQEDKKYKQVVHALGAPHTGYAGVTVYGVLHVEAEDRISVLHDCTGMVRGQYSNITVKSIA